MATMVYGDISPRTAAFAVKQLLKRGMPYLVLEKFGQTYPLPSKSSTTAKFRRYEALSATPAALTEGVTPTGSVLTNTDYTVTLSQYGDFVSISDVVLDTHEDPVLQQATEILGEQQAQMIETVRFNVLKAGTNILYANGTSRSAVNTAISLTLQRQAIRTLKRQNARFITSVVKSTTNFNTEPVGPAFIGLVHPDVENDIRNMVDANNNSVFTPVEKYGTMTPFDGEIGKVENVRYIISTIFTQWADAGGTAGSMLSTTGTNADVYPVLILGKDAYGIVPLKGKNATGILVNNPKPTDGDELAQRGSVGWKAMQNAVILNDNWMIRLEVAATA